MLVPKARRLTLKQERFAAEYVANGGNGTQAALAVYNSVDPVTAATTAYDNLRKPQIAERVEQALQENGLTPAQITKNLGFAANQRPEKGSMDSMIKANVELLKIMGAYPGSTSAHLNVNLNADLSKMTPQEARKKIQEINKDNTQLLQDIEQSTEGETITPIPSE